MRRRRLGDLEVKGGRDLETKRLREGEKMRVRGTKQNQAISEFRKN